MYFLNLENKIKPKKIKKYLILCLYIIILKKCINDG